MHFWLSQFAAFSLSFFVPLGLLIFLLENIKQSSAWSGLRPWLWVWLGLLIPITPQILTGRFPLWLILQFLIVLFASWVLRSFHKLTFGLTLSLIVIFVFYIVFFQLSKQLWLDPYTTPSLLKTLSGISVINNNSTHLRSFGKSWSSATSEFQLSFEARSQETTPTWEWYRYNTDFRLEPFTDTTGQLSVHVIPPALTEKSRYIAQELFTGKTLAGRTFRASIDLRSEQVQKTEGCNGIILQENGGKYRGQCLALELKPEWQTFHVEWRAPENILTQHIRIVLNNLESPYDLRNVKLEEKLGESWQTLGPLEPSGISIRPFTENTRRQNLPSYSFVPVKEWKTYNFEFNLETPVHRLILQTQAGANLELRNITLFDITKQKMLQELPLNRHSLWFPQANLAGHSITILGLALLININKSWQGMSVILLTLTCLFFTGSRTAWIGALIGMPWLLLLRIPSRQKIPGILGIILLGCGLIFMSDFNNSRVFNPEDDNSVKRTEIWKVAWQGFLTHPWSGLGESPKAFKAYWESNPQAPRLAADHAHNFWLHFAVTYGISGLAASIWITLALGRLAWKWGRLKGLVLVAVVCVMNVFDYTLFYSGFLSLFILTINTLNLQYNTSAQS